MRLDRALLSRGLARSRSRARELIDRGDVQVNGRVVRRAAQVVSTTDAVDAVVDPYVSRAAAKLIGALGDLGLRPAGRALDAGASTGGFTQVLLEQGCTEVIAVDVGTDQLVPSLRADPRVRVWEQTSLRDLTLNHVAGRPVDLVVADVSFISLTLLVEPLTAVLDPEGDLLLMVKPQFEVGRERLGRGGVVHSAELRLGAVRAVAAAAAAVGWQAHAAVPSRVLGAGGNQETFVWFRSSPPSAPADLGAAVGS